MHEKVTQLNGARRQIRQLLQDGVIRGGHSPVAGSSDFRLCAQQKHKPLLSPQRRTGWIGQDIRQMNKMARHKQCQKLGGSRNADLTAPQGVTPQTLLIPNTTKLLHREGGWVTKLL